MQCCILNDLGYFEVLYHGSFEGSVKARFRIKLSVNGMLLSIKDNISFVVL